MSRFEIEHVATPDGEPCGHVSVGVDEQHADEMHLYHCLNDHDLDPMVEAVVRDRLMHLERA